MKMSQLPEDFAASIDDFESYPENLTHRTPYLGALKTYKTWLDITEKKLFTQEVRDINVLFHDSIDFGPSTLISLAPDHQS